MSSITDNEDALPLAATMLRKSYGRGRRSQRVVDDVDLVVRSGQFLLLAGRNGAGKSTILRLLAGFIRPDSGRVAIFGHRPNDPPARRRTAFLADQSTLFPHLDARETVRFFSEISGSHPADRKDAVERVVEALGMRDYAKKRVKSYSLGMRRRLAVASLVIQQPGLYLMDEPTSGLDTEGVDLVALALAEEKARGASFVLSSHQFHVVLPLVDQIVHLDSGRTVFKGSVEDLIAASDRRMVEFRLGESKQSGEFASWMSQRGGEVSKALTAARILEERIAGHVGDGHAG